MAFPLPLLLLGGAAVFLGGKKKRRRASTQLVDQEPWYLLVYDKQRSEAEWRAKRCANKDEFLKEVLPALKERMREFVDEAMAANFVGYGEGDPAGIAYRADLEATVQNLLAVHCE